MKLFGKIIFIIGILCLIFGFVLIWQRNNPKRIVFTNTEIKAQEIDKNPIELVISSQNIDLPIIESKVVNHNWEVTDKGISRIGNVYYGHNWNNLLGNLVKVKPDDIIEIKYNDNKVKKFKVTITQVVNPDQKDVLNLATKNTILIYTCTGFMDSKRFIVTASEI